MATTLVQPIMPFGGQSQGAHMQWVLPTKASTAYQAGDALEFDTNQQVIPDNGSGTMTRVIGFAMISPSGTFTEVASPDPDDNTISIAVCWPGSLFEGSIVTTATPDDHTGARDNDLGKVGGDAFDAVESTDGFLCIREDVSASDVFNTIRYGKQNDGTEGATSGVGKTNPRVVFFITPSKTILGA